MWYRVANAVRKAFCGTSENTVSDTQNPAKPGFYLIEMNDSRLPDFGGLKLAAARQIAVDSTRDFLNLCHRRLAER